MKNKHPAIKKNMMSNDNVLSSELIALFPKSNIKWK